MPEAELSLRVRPDLTHNSFSFFSRSSKVVRQTFPPSLTLISFCQTLSHLLTIPVFML